MKITNVAIIIACKIISKAITLFNIGSGSTWPGHIALALNKNFIKEQIENNKKLKVILIAGTNGKTTTAKLTQYLLEKNSIRVFQNEEGANLLNGITSTMIKYSNIFGQLTYEAAIFEVDENSLPLILKEIKHPAAIVILNLFRDQLDRYGEVNTIALKWEQSLSDLDKNTFLFLNGDDPQVYYLSKNLKTKNFFFGIDKSFMKKKDIPHDVDSIYCPKCSSKLVYNAISYSHLGDYYCAKCGLKPDRISTFSDLKIKYPLFGKYNIYNINAAMLLVSTVFDIKFEKIEKYIEGFKPAFGRQEIVKFQGRNLIILLSKNPTGFNQSIEALSESSIKNKNALIVLNDRIPDGRDISWIWDVDFENIIEKVNKIYISGDRTFDLAIRFKYISGNLETRKINEDLYSLGSNIFVIPDLKNSVKIATDRAAENETLFILATYSGMLDIRKIVNGKKLI